MAGDRLASCCRASPPPGGLRRGGPLVVGFGQTGLAYRSRTNVKVNVLALAPLATCTGVSTVAGS